ncbi:PBP1A family penicillin-binding protein [Candidatus Parcubacteria bacterium]|nr:PBP1A family penicillin-binding protein [Candidatus Parcubacteria bacterium]
MKYGKIENLMRKLRQKLAQSNHFLAISAVGLFACGLVILWVASLRIPALESIQERKVDQSTKIYDRTGEILLYDFSQDVRRDEVPIDQVSDYAKNAAIAIEDKDFYHHNGFDFTSFLRAVWVNLTTLSFSQGGSTITQQVVKNSILTNDKSPTRKLKELILALKLEKVLTKEEILSLYLNEIPYGGNVYGIEEASQRFFGTKAADLTLAESAYLAAIPQAPTHYSPYGTHLEDLEARKNLVLREMLKNGFITQAEEEKGMAEKVSFKPRENTGSIKAPHFVFFVIDELVKKYGEDAVQNGGWKVITSLDYKIQQGAEASAAKYGAINQKTFNANNNAIVAIDPKTGEILAMTGSRNYFDKEIGGNFNAATSHRQPGSTFKPFVYSVLFNRGFTDSTVLYDVPIQFNPSCAPDDLTTHDDCYAPGNYDEKFRGPMTIRNALAQSINLPAVEASYLAGVDNSVKLATAMGIQSLTEKNTYGLSLVLGGGAVSLLDMVSAYGVFANDGMRNPYVSVLSIEDAYGNTIDKSSPSPERVLPEQTARIMNSILSDNVARTPGYGPNSPLYVPDRDVAVKTGTSNDYRDAWIIGYAPNLVIGAWTGNNDNSPMEKKVAGLIVSPLWREMMDKVLPNLPAESFVAPEPEDPATLKPVLRGEVAAEPHSILYSLDKDNPRGPMPSNPGRDPQFNNWEYAVRRWALASSPAPVAGIPAVQQVAPAAAGAGFVPLPF